MGAIGVSGNGNDRDLPTSAPHDKSDAPEVAGLTAQQVEGRAELEASVVGDDVRGFARAYLSPYLPAYLERIAKEATKGGRRTEASTKLYADIMGLREKVQILNLFIDRLGVDEQQARAAVDLKRRLDTLGEDEIAELVARSLAQYVKRKPDRRGRVVALLEMGLAHESGNGVGSGDTRPE